MSVATQIQAQIAEQQRDYQARLGDLAAQETSTKAKFGTDASGALDFINPQDPFSVTGALKRLFRQQDTSQNLSAFAGGFGWDGSTQFEKATSAVEHQQQQRDVADQYNEAIAGIGRARTELEGGFRGNVAGLNAQLAQAFADEQAATLGAAAAAAPGPGEAGSTPSGATKVARSRAHGGAPWVYRQGASGKWIPVRPA